MRLCDVGAAVQEVMESYEVELDGKTYQVGISHNWCCLVSISTAREKWPSVARLQDSTKAGSQKTNTTKLKI